MLKRPKQLGLVPDVLLRFGVLARCLTPVKPGVGEGELTANLVIPAKAVSVHLSFVSKRARAARSDGERVTVNLVLCCRMVYRLIHEVLRSGV